MKWTFELIPRGIPDKEYHRVLKFTCVPFHQYRLWALWHASMNLDSVQFCCVELLGSFKSSKWHVTFTPGFDTGKANFGIFVKGGPRKS